MAEAIRLVGMTPLLRAFGAMDRALEQDLRDALEESAQPVKLDAQMLAGTTIRNLHEGDPWSRFRIGVTRSLVYMAPLERGVKSRGNRVSRGRGQGTGPPSFADILMGRAMEPALERNRTQVENRLDRMLDEVCDVWERGA